jgi:hypothetical protein
MLMNDMAVVKIHAVCEKTNRNSCQRCVPLKES